jgi:ParB/RepB/Spo0J family partition protein
MERNEKYDAFNIPVACIYYDGDFNCRGEFTPQSVHELSQSIQKRGLDFPLVVQPAGDVEGGLPDFKQYRLLCGHRRFMAITTFLDWTRIPCIMRGGLSDREARLLNLTENLERRDLNPLEEALAIGRLFPKGATLVEISKAVRRSTTWVKYRLDIAKLPADLQQSVASGVLKVNDVRFIVSRDPKDWAEAARFVIREERRHNSPHEGRGLSRRKRRSQINVMIERLFDAGLTGLYPRLLVWALGLVEDSDIESDIRSEILRFSTGRGILPCDKDDCRIVWSPGWNNGERSD